MRNERHLPLGSFLRVCIDESLNRAEVWIGLDKEVLVPLTSSLYVPGKLTDVASVVVDVGTGYCVKKVCVCEFLINIPSLETPPRALSY